MVEREKRDLMRQADATEEVAIAYSTHPENDIEIFVAGARTAGELRETAEMDMGLNRETLELAREGRMRVLESQGVSPEEDQWLALINQQLSFTQRMQGNFAKLSETTVYRQQLETVWMRNEEARKNRNPSYLKPPEGFYNPRQMERYQKAKSIVDVATQDFAAETGQSSLKVQSKFQHMMGRFKFASFVFEHGKTGHDERKPWEKRLRVEYLSGGKIRGKDSLQVRQNIPLLVSHKDAQKDKFRFINLDQALAIFRNPVEEAVIQPFIQVENITAGNVKALLTLAAESKGWTS